MKLSTSHALLGALAPLASAFPAAVFEAARDPAQVARAKEILATRASGDAAAAQLLFEPIPTFNAAKQYIDISEASGHAYVAPGPTDNRGPCPGLNAFANHNFLPHNGYATIQQFTDVTTQVVGMGEVLAVFLSVLGAALDGSATAWSIGGTPLASVGSGNGISGSHNKYESDASPTRPDLYEAGNDYKTVAAQFQQLIDASPGSVTMQSLTDFRSHRFDTQIANNPYFFNGPFSGVAVQPAAYTFIYRFMANHSEASPYGYLDYDVIKTWFGITGESGNFVANQGQEKIPENWYRRPLEYPYEIDYFTVDLANAAAQYPKFLDIGGNTGTVNTFTGVDITNLTGGVFNLETFAQGNNAACFATQLATQAKPDLVLGLLDTLTNALGQVDSKLGCSQLADIDESQLSQFPGYTRSNV